MISKYQQERRSKRKRIQTKVFDPNEYNGYDKYGNKNKYHYHNNPYDRGFDYTAVGKGLEEEEEEDRIIECEMKNKKTTKQGYVKHDFTEFEEECSDEESEEEYSDEESEEEYSDEESEEECSDEESEEECSDEESDDECNYEELTNKLIRLKNKMNEWRRMLDEESDDE